ELDGAVREFLLRREYPGNVRDLQEVVSQLMHRATADRTITIGCVPAHQRPVLEPDKIAWLDCHFERPIQRAVLLGAALKEIGRPAGDVAVRYAMWASRFESNAGTILVSLLFIRSISRIQTIPAGPISFAQAWPAGKGSALAVNWTQSLKLRCLTHLASPRVSGSSKGPTTLATNPTLSSLPPTVA